MICLVTGAAGFIGSHLCDALLEAGHTVVGVDAFIPYYPRSIKERNLISAQQHERFIFHERDLRFDDITPLLRDVEIVFHLAAMGGLLKSWTDFDSYMTCNIQATQRLLEAARTASSVHKFIYSSTSSVYGHYVTGPETTLPQPVSPYGITKLAAEQLVQTYDYAFDMPTTILRYFSVYGPRQRPDMGYHLFIDHILRDEPIVVWGDGTQLRANTYVADIVQANLLASSHFRRGTIYNIGGGEEVSANGIITLLEGIIGKRAMVTHGPPRLGEQQRTMADITHARKHLGFTPTVPLFDGLEAQVAWQRQLLEPRESS